MVCVLSIEEAIGIPCRYTRTSALDAVARFSGIQSLRNAFRRTNPGNLGRLQMETLESGFIENKGVPACKRIGTSQFPIGDDVSALHPLRSSVGISAVSPPIHQYPSSISTPRSCARSLCLFVSMISFLGAEPVNAPRIYLPSLAHNSMAAEHALVRGVSCQLCRRVRNIPYDSQLCS